MRIQHGGRGMCCSRLHAPGRSTDRTCTHAHSINLDTNLATAAQFRVSAIPAMYIVRDFGQKVHAYHPRPLTPAALRVFLEEKQWLNDEAPWSGIGSPFGWGCVNVRPSLLLLLLLLLLLILTPRCHSWVGCGPAADTVIDIFSLLHFAILSLAVVAPSPSSCRLCPITWFVFGALAV